MNARFSRSAWSALSLALLAGCATPVYNYSPSSVDVSEPPLNVITKAHVGDILVRQGRYAEQAAIRVNDEAFLGLLNGYTIKKGFYVKQGEDAETEFYLPSSRDGGAIVKSLLADPPKMLQAFKASRKMCVVTVFHTTACNDNVNFDRTKQSIESADSFQQALIYSGRVGNRVKIGYREFSTNMARPAFNNEAEYDLNDSRTIGYKNARIEIIDATNEALQYRVLSNFNTK